MRALDLRQKLLKELAHASAQIAELPELLERSRQRRGDVLAAAGTLGTSAQQRWETQWTADCVETDEIARELQAVTSTDDRSARQELETRLCEVHMLGLRIVRLRNKYQSDIAADRQAGQHTEQLFQNRFIESFEARPAR